VLSDLLGHRDPESISAYVRIATETLRDVSLPVPAHSTDAERPFHGIVSSHSTAS
jgi:hypothetical protein